MKNNYEQFKIHVERSLYLTSYTYKKLIKDLAIYKGAIDNLENLKKLLKKDIKGSVKGTIFYQIKKDPSKYKQFLELINLYDYVVDIPKEEKRNQLKKHKTLINKK